MTPDDDLVRIGEPDGYPIPKVDEIHVSCLFTWHKEYCERLHTAWAEVAAYDLIPIRLGGPAFGDAGGEFVPNRYVKAGCVITSRGCPNKCWFCDVHRREGDLREVPISDGWNVLDSNILACSEAHIREVFKMLARQERRAEFTGGLEARILEWWHVKLLWRLRPSQMFFAYDTPADYEPLIQAGRMLRRADFTRRHLRCYVLIGYPKDSIGDAEQRLLRAWDAGFMPMAMLWRNTAGDTAPEWRKLQRNWARPAITRKVVRDLLCPDTSGLDLAQVGADSGEASESGTAHVRAL